MVDKDYYQKIVYRNLDTIFEKKDKELINLIFDEEVSQEKIDAFFKLWDIEVAGGEKSLILSYFVKDHSEFKYPEFALPRLNGLLNYYRFQNLKQKSIFTKVCNQLVSKGTVPIVINDTLMKAFRPEYPRVIRNFELLIPNKYPNDVNYEETTIINTSNEIYDRALTRNIFGINMLVPSYEDCYFYIVSRIYTTINEPYNLYSIYFTIMDIDYILKQKTDFDWNIVYEDVVNNNLEKTFIISLLIVKYLNPQLFPNELYEMLLEKIDKDDNLVIYKMLYNNIKYKEQIKNKIKNPFSTKQKLSFRQLILWLKHEIFYGFMNIPLCFNSKLLANLFIKTFI